jgi:hypothetical protein
VGARRPQHELDYIHSLARPAAAQAAYLYAARASGLASLRDGDDSAAVAIAEDVRQSIGAPMILTHKPGYVISDDLGPYYWFEGIQEALADGKWSGKDEPYRNLWRAARGILWNRMRDEDRDAQIRRDASLPLLGEAGIVVPRPERMELRIDCERVLERLGHNSEFRRMIETIQRSADGETAVLNRRGKQMRLDLERRFPYPLEEMWAELGGYMQRHRQIAYDRLNGFRIESRDHRSEKRK